MTKTNNTKKIATFLINAYITKVENQQKYIIDNDIKIVTAISEVASIKALFPKQKDYEGFILSCFTIIVFNFECRHYQVRY